MDEYLHTLEETQEAPYDLLLVQLVRLQLIIDDTPKAPLALQDPSEQLGLSHQFQAKALLSRVQVIRENFPPQAPEDGR
jgi:hypothetical protein